MNIIETLKSERQRLIDTFNGEFKYGDYKLGDVLRHTYKGEKSNRFPGDVYYLHCERSDGANVCIWVYEPKFGTVEPVNVTHINISLTKV